MLKPEEAAVLLARLDFHIQEAQTIRIELQQQAAERREQDRWILPAFGLCPPGKRRT